MLIITFSAITSCALINNDQLNDDFYQLQALPASLQNKVFLETLTFEALTFEALTSKASNISNSKQGEKKTLLTQIETGENTLSLGAMTFSGLPIIQAKWHSTEGLVGFSSMTFDKNMAMRIIRDIQLVKWPDDVITSGLSPGYELFTSQKSTVKTSIVNTSTVKKSAAEWEREIKNSGKTLVKITYLENKIILINALEHYQLTIEQVNE